MNPADAPNAIFRGAFFRIRGHEPGQCDDGAVHLHLDVGRIDEVVQRKRVVDLLADLLVWARVVAGAAGGLISPPPPAPTPLPGGVAPADAVVVALPVIWQGGLAAPQATAPALPS